MPFIPHTEQDVAAMLSTIGVDDTEALFDEIPAALRIENLHQVPDGLGEAAVTQLMRARAVKDGGVVSFIGAGAYEHHIPAAVWEIATRGEFYSAYTPYQAEASQGTLQVIYEYQTMMASLTGLDISNASLYDGATAFAEACLMAVRGNRKCKSRKILVSQSVNPFYRAVARRITSGQGIEFVEIGCNGGQTERTALESLGDDARGENEFAAICLQQPTFLGTLDDVDALTDWAHAKQMFVIAICNPTSLAILSPPGEWGEAGADIACGEGQPLGIPVASGGPYFGYMVCREQIVRQMPGRIVGRTVDLDGKPGFTLTLQAREQHIRRSKATSNICTNQGLMVTAATIYLSILGSDGLRRTALQCHANTRLLAEKLSALDSVSMPFDRFFHEVVVQFDRPVAPLIEALARQNILAGYDLSDDYPGLGHALLVCATEMRTEAEIDTYVAALQSVLNETAFYLMSEPVIFELSAPGRRAGGQAPAAPPAASLPDEFLRRSAPLLPEVSELQAVRHFTRLSQLNFSIDTHFYPLGSCTMKYNPRACNRLAMLPAFTERHPLGPVEHAQGFLECMYELQEMLKVVTGMTAISLTPMAGAQGEFAGIAMIRAYHDQHGDHDRREIIVPDAAHGTNPATAAMCGCTAVEIPTGPDGDVDLDALRAAVGPNTAGIMLTNPSTLGVFERQISEIAEIVHTAGGLLYYDGANLNAILGRALPGDMGFDVIHLNLHKTFSTPHGGGGPGSGVVGVSPRLEPYLPVPMIGKEDRSDGDRYVWLTEADRPQSIGRLSAFMGNAGILLRAYIYMRLLGAEGMRRVSEFATLNANYLMKVLAEAGFEVTFAERRASHEFIVSLKPIARETGITAMDFAKALLDRGFHAPTTYFPLLVPECLLIEPTETETKQELDAFVAALIDIRDQAYVSPETIKAAPVSMPVRRLDDVRAVRQLDVVWQPDTGAGE